MNKFGLGNVVFILASVFGGLIITGAEPSSKIKYQSSYLKNLSVDENASSTLTTISEETINVVIKLNYDCFDSSDYLNEDDLETSKQNLISNGRAYYSSRNNNIMKNIDTTRMEDLYVSRYSPFITFSISNSILNKVYSTDLVKLADKDYISEINVYRSETYKPLLTTNKKETGVTNIINEYGVTGEEVKVGMLECGILDKDNANFSGKNVVARDQWFRIEKVTDHATAVASIIGGSTGIATDCSIYSVQLFGSDPIDEIEWLLDQNVDVINMSFGDENPTGVYSNFSAYIDYVSNTYKTIFIGAIGNEGDSSGYVGNPGMGYNVLGIGCCDYRSPVPLTYSAYKEVDGPDKPNITAPGSAIEISNIYGSHSGTSFSSAFVTGCVALMLEYRPVLKLHPERVYALLMANTTSVTQVSKYIGLKDDSGTGGLNITKVFQNIDSMLYGTVTNKTTFEDYIDIFIEKNKTVKVAAFWLAYADGTASNTKHTDYDLFFMDSSPSYVLKAQTNKNNYEYFEWKCTADDTYTLTFDLVGNMSQTKDQYCVAISIY